MSATVVQPLQKVVHDWKQLVSFVPAEFGIEPVGEGRRFYHIRRDQNDLSRADTIGGFTETWLRNSLIEVGETETGEVVLTAPLSYLLRKGVIGLMSEDGAAKFFERDASHDVRHHPDDDAPALGLNPGELTNANLAEALAGDFLPDPVIDDGDDDDDDEIDPPPIQVDTSTDILGSILLD